MIKAMELQSNNKLFKGAAAIIAAAGICWLLFGHNVAGYYHVLQEWPGGKLRIIQAPGIYWKGPFSKVTKFQISSVVSFVDTYEEQKKRRIKIEDAIVVTFRDNGQGTVNGFVRYSLPADEEQMKLIVSIARTEEILQRLIKANINTALTLVSANYESGDSVKNRGQFIRDILDSLRNGLIAYDKKVVDGKILTTPRVDANSEIERMPGISSRFGLGIANFTLKHIEYDNQTQTKLDEHRLLEQERNIAILSAEKLKQETITAAAEEEKLLAETRAQEEHKKLEATIQAEMADEVARIKAESDRNIALVLAEKDREVAEIELAQAKIEKEALVTEAEGKKEAALSEAEGRKALAEADGSLELKLAMQKETLIGIAEALKDVKVPTTIIGRSEGDTGSGNPILDIFLMNQIKQLESVDVEP
ncbi:MAG: SPFH domain-containing protein [Kiritimatiellia bacterium]|jgi:regulator of protease activity HflC (stomatin/prohibitin superfamily)|nr:SPFH domain-containing protein [Kiritimatiellia bacterium]MDP6809866.1 SPFH domain-containing protein [Kiritimatiellia bacterium]